MSPRALVTGGQQGIGLGIARALAGAGWEVVIAAERPEGDGAVTDALAELGAGARYLRHDLADLAAVPALVEAAGRIDAYVSNAGVPARVRGDMLALAMRALTSLLYCVECVYGGVLIPNGILGAPAVLSSSDSQAMYSSMDGPSYAGGGLSWMLGHDRFSSTASGAAISVCAAATLR